MGKYSQFFSIPSHTTLTLRALGLRFPLNVPGMSHSSCWICGRDYDYVTDSIKFVYTWNQEEEKIICECNRHGGKSGKQLNDCTTGKVIFIQPENNALFFIQDVKRLFMIGLRYSAFFMQSVFFWIITRNDTVSEWYRKVAKV